MQWSTLALNVPDGTSLHVNRWLPDGPPKAIVQLAHGMGEHSERYARFAQELTEAGYAVYANDHRGHGRTARTPRDEGYYADERGFDTAVHDLHRLTATAKHEHPGLPLFLVGHSMGSFLGRSYAASFGYELSGLVLIGTAGDLGLLTVVGRYLAQLEGLVRGRRAKSPLLGWLSVGQYNNPFKPNRTKFDWLTRDEAEVDLYIADAKCGNDFTCGFFADLLGGLTSINSDATVARVPKDLPIHLVSGSLDPVGNFSKGVVQVAEQYARHGIADVTTTLWDDARHEVLNETNRAEVTAELIGWLDAHLAEIQAARRGGSADSQRQAVLA